MEGSDQHLWQFWATLTVQAAVALATVAAVVVALFGRWFQLRYFPPDLSLRIPEPTGEPVDPTFLTPSGQPTVQTKSRWLRVRLENRRRWSPANNAHVYLTSVEVPDATGTHAALWTGWVPLKGKQEHIVLVGRTVGSAIDFDICSVIKGYGLQVHPIIRPNNLPEVWSAGSQLRLTVQARSDEIEVPGPSG